MQEFLHFFMAVRSTLCLLGFCQADSNLRFAPQTSLLSRLCSIILDFIADSLEIFQSHRTLNSFHRPLDAVVLGSLTAHQNARALAFFYGSKKHFVLAWLLPSGLEPAVRTANKFALTPLFDYSRFHR